MFPTRTISQPAGETQYYFQILTPDILEIFLRYLQPDQIAIFRAMEKRLENIPSLQAIATLKPLDPEIQRSMLSHLATQDGVELLDLADLQQGIIRAYRENPDAAQMMRNYISSVQEERDTLRQLNDDNSCLSKTSKRYETFSRICLSACLLYCAALAIAMYLPTCENGCSTMYKLLLIALVTLPALYCLGGLAVGCAALCTRDIAKQKATYVELDAKKIAGLGIFSSKSAQPDDIEAGLLSSPQPD